MFWLPSTDQRLYVRAYIHTLVRDTSTDIHALVETHVQVSDLDVFDPSVRVSSLSPQEPSVIVKGNLIHCVIVVGYSQVDDDRVHSFIGRIGHHVRYLHRKNLSFCAQNQFKWYFGYFDETTIIYFHVNKHDCWGDLPYISATTKTLAHRCVIQSSESSKPFLYVGSIFGF